MKLSTLSFPVRPQTRTQSLRLYSIAAHPSEETTHHAYATTTIRGGREAIIRNLDATTQLEEDENQHRIHVLNVIYSISWAVSRTHKGRIAK